VYVSVHGYGPTGPLASTAGHDINFLATAGLLSLTKDAAGKPVLPGFQLADVAGGAYSTIVALQAALLRRFLSPAGAVGAAGGAHVQVDMTAACVPLLAVPLSLRGAGPLGTDLPNILDGTSAVNYAVYATRDGRYLAVGALEQKFWSRMCDLIGRPDWGGKSQMELLAVLFPKAELEAVFKSRTLAEWTVIFHGEEVCVTPVLELEEVLEMPYHTERESFVEVANPTGSTLSARGGKTVLTAGLPFFIDE
jgi:crotonobetainyl-CoA:carnitine CoA-transferase CaiB-like acyl-CoA transferase